MVLFFVLSGFLMALRQTRDGLSPGAFIYRRLSRIVPLYTISTIAYATALTVTARPPSLDLLAHSLSFSETLAGGGIPLVWVGWTIEYEVLFYLLYGFVMFVAKEFQNTLVVLGVSTLVILGLDPIALNFVFGILAASIFEALGKHRGCRLAWSSAAAISGLALVLAWISEPNLPGWFHGLLGAASVLSLAKAHELRNQMVSYLGEASYSIYLVQVFTIPLTLAILRMQTLPPIGVNLTAGCALVITIATGVAVHRLVDSKVQILLRKLAR